MRDELSGEARVVDVVPAIRGCVDGVAADNETDGYYDEDGTVAHIDTGM